MKKNEFLKSLKIIALGLILSFGVSIVSAAWTQPTGRPNDTNTPSPINVSSTSQTKSGPLSVGVSNENLINSSGIKTSSLLSGNSIKITSFMNSIIPGGKTLKYEKVCISSDGTLNKCVGKW